MAVHPSFRHAPYDNQRPFVPMLAYLPHSFHWHIPPPPPIPHKVWVIDCKSCHTFITNRAMKAVLLLRPNVSLFSSDALPINCSPYTTNPDALRPRPYPSFHIPPRTCECLTQTLCCHSCGSTVGYMIVIPCTRCTSSISSTNRATNGHRFVFHATEVVGTERRYIPDEPGVIPYEPLGVPITPDPDNQTSLYSSMNSRHMDNPFPRSPSPSHTHFSDYLPTPPLELADSTVVPSAAPPLDAFPFPRGHSYSTSEPHHLSSHATGPYPPSFFPHPHSRFPPVSLPSHHLINRPVSTVFSRPSSTTPPLSFPLGVPSEQKELPHPPKLQAGDILYWHHLAKNGEIPAVEEDERARGNNKPTATTDGKHSAPLSFDR